MVEFLNSASLEKGGEASGWHGNGELSTSEISSRRYHTYFCVVSVHIPTILIFERSAVSYCSTLQVCSGVSVEKEPVFLILSTR